MSVRSFKGSNTLSAVGVGPKIRSISGGTTKWGGLDGIRAVFPLYFNAQPDLAQAGQSALVAEAFDGAEFV